MKVYVVFDPLVEEVCSVHKSYKIAEKKAVKLDKERALQLDEEYDANGSYLHEVKDRELEE